jgi:hypothetical protein
MTPQGGGIIIGGGVTNDRVDETLELGAKTAVGFDFFP